MSSRLFALRLYTLAMALLTLLMGVVVLTGCAEPSYWFARTFYGVECHPDKLHNGNCVPVKKGGSNAQTAQP